ncbi:MAG: hypothetical protein ACRD1Z_12275 [Vicinamibacteria bacterium]
MSETIRSAFVFWQLGIFSGSIFLPWLYEGSGASLFVAALWHTSVNLGCATEAGEATIAVALTALVIAAAFAIARVSWKERAMDDRLL